MQKAIKAVGRYTFYIIKYFLKCFMPIWKKVSQIKGLNTQLKQFENCKILSETGFCEILV